MWAQRRLLPSLVTGSELAEPSSQTDTLKDPKHVSHSCGLMSDDICLSRESTHSGVGGVLVYMLLLRLWRQRGKTHKDHLFTCLCVYQYLLRLEEGIEFPRVGVTVDYETPDACVLGSKLSSGTAKASEPSLSSSEKHFYFHLSLGGTEASG